MIILGKYGVLGFPLLIEDNENAQKRLFELGFSWVDGNTDIEQHYDKQHLIIINEDYFLRKKFHVGEIKSDEDEKGLRDYNKGRFITVEKFEDVYMSGMEE